MKKLREIIILNRLLYIRILLFFCFMGHGLVSLHLSPGGYHLHYNIFSSVNIFNFNPETFLLIQATFDIVVALMFLFNIQLLNIIPVVLSYLVLVAIAAGMWYVKKTGGIFGVTEFTRRIPWMLSVLFLWFALKQGKNYLFLLRVGIAFAFLAHGLASIGFLGLKGGHIEIASNILSEEAATRFVYYSGFSDAILGLLLLTGFLSRWAAIVGCVWLVFVVYLSFLTGLPEGLFRIGFLMICIYVAVDKGCHTWKNEDDIDDLELAPLKA